MAAFARALILIAMTGAFAGPALAFDPYGVWFREESGTKFDFYNCDSKLCARVIDVSKTDDRKVIGTVILRNAAKTGPNEWSGDLYNSKDGKIYSGTITVNSLTDLSLKGCLMIFCQTEKWVKLPAAEQVASSTPNGKPIMMPPGPPGQIAPLVPMPGQAPVQKTSVPAVPANGAKPATPAPPATAAASAPKPPAAPGTTATTAPKPATPAATPNAPQR